VGNVGDMTEHETDPQRPDGPAGATPADESSDGEQPTVQQPAAPSGPAPPAAPQPGPVAPPWASPWQQHPGYGYQYPGYHQPYATPAWAAAPGQTSEQPGSWAPGGTEQPAPNWGEQAAPSWMAPVGTDPPRDAERTRRGRRIFAGVAAALLIALASGGIGAATAVALDNNDGTTAVKTGNSSITRVVDRSSLAQIAAAVQDSVVSITTESGEGSGVILSADGDILTNNHVVATAQGNTVQVIFANGNKATARIVGTDPRTDLAVIKASGVSGLKPATFGDSSQMQVGDTVLAIGSPLGLEGSVTAGIISAKDRTIQSSDQTPQDPFGNGGQQSGSVTMSGLLQTDAPINPGNSGGALVNTNGQVIGINSAIATSGQGSGNIGLGFAIPSNKAKVVANDLLAGRKVSHPALGVSVTGAEGGGALVSSVVANSAAAKAGLQQGDVITSVNGKPVNDSDDLVGIIQSANVGDKVTIVFTRNGAEKTVTATLAEAG
jgi:putative serine protease PepD